MRSSKQRDDIASLSNPEIRQNLARLYAKEADLAAKLLAPPEPSPAVQVSLKKLEPGLVSSLRSADARTTLEQHIMRIGTMIEEIDQRILKLRRSRVLRILTGGMNVGHYLLLWPFIGGVSFIAALGIAYVVTTLGPMLQVRPADGVVVWKNSWAIIASTAFVLIYLSNVRDNVRNYKASLDSLLARRAEFTSTIDDRTTLARTLKIVAPYVRAKAAYDEASQSLARTRDEIAKHQALLRRRIDRSRTAIPAAVKREVMKRDGGCCVGCGGKKDLQFDHIIPYSMGGGDTVENLQILCRSCNLAKGATV